MKKTLAGMLTMSLFVLCVGAHDSPVVDEKQADVVVIHDDAGFEFDGHDFSLQVMALHADVPEVQKNVLVHQEEIEPTANGYKPAKEARARAPTAKENRLNTRPRDKPLRC